MYIVVSHGIISIKSLLFTDLRQQQAFNHAAAAAGHLTGGANFYIENFTYANSVVMERVFEHLSNISFTGITVCWGREGEWRGGGGEGERGKGKGGRGKGEEERGKGKGGRGKRDGTGKEDGRGEEGMGGGGGERVGMEGEVRREGKRWEIKR